MAKLNNVTRDKPVHWLERSACTCQESKNIRNSPSTKTSPTKPIPCPVHPETKDEIQRAHQMKEEVRYYDLITWQMYHRIQRARAESETPREEKNGHNASFVSTSSTTRIEQYCGIISSPSLPTANEEHDESIFDFEL